MHKKYIKIFEEFIEDDALLKKISGGFNTPLESTIKGIFKSNEKCFDEVKDFMDNHSKRLELGEHGYINLSEMDGLDNDNLLSWFSKFILGNGKVVGKGEVLLSILFNNVFKTPILKSNDETGDLFLSDDNGKTSNGRIEVKSALPGGFMFKGKIYPEDLEKLGNGERLAKAYRNYIKAPLGNFVMDKDLFVELCVYCIAKYMHGQYPKEKNYYFLIFDNQPHINSRGNIHGTEDKKINKIINYDGSVEDVEDTENVKSDIRLDDDNDDLSFYKPEEKKLSDGVSKSENGNEEMDVKDVRGFLYIKRCNTIEETMNRIMSFVDKESFIYKENKSKVHNNFTFYVKNKKICIAHRDNPPLVKNKNKTK
jgi:hypothetical protein